MFLNQKEFDNLSTNKLKLIALMAMLIDHIGYFIPGTPEWFRWIGRIAMPVFIFTLVIGFQYTSNRKHYLIRLYAFNLGMCFINFFINYLFRDFSIEDLKTNFFAPLFLIAFVLTLIEKRKTKLILYFCVWQVVTFIFCVFLGDSIGFPNFNSPVANGQIWGSVMGNIILVEGGPLPIIMGILLYKVLTRKVTIALVFTLFSICYFLVSYKWSHLYTIWTKLFFPFPEFQWMMIAALPLILLHNNKKGRGMKYFFYIFYPIHIIILYLIGFYLMEPSTLRIQ